MLWIYRTSLGQDHHRFTTLVEQTAPIQSDLVHIQVRETHAFPTQKPAATPQNDRPLILAGVEIPGPPLAGNSDADVVLHALCNAISGLSSINFLGPPADELCNIGVINSEIYVLRALEDLYAQRPGAELIHLSISIEGRKPKLWDYIPKMKDNLSRILQIPVKDIGLTATTGEGLTGMGRGEGLACLAILTLREPENTPQD